MPLNYTIYKHCLVWAGDTSDEQFLTSEEAKKLLKSNNAWMLRNCWDWDCKRATDFWEIICDKHYEIADLPSKTRNQIRRALRDCVIMPVTARQLIDDGGYEVYRLAFGRYHNIERPASSKSKWINDLQNGSNKEYWGVYEKNSGNLIAWAMNTVNGKSVSYNTLKAIPEMMNKHYPYYGLLYEMNKYYLKERRFDYVSDGWRSVSQHSGIQPFLEKNFMFRKAFCNMRLHYAPWFGISVKCLFYIRRLKLLPTAVRNILKFEEINRLQDA